MSESRREIIDRWDQTLRFKASEYEHTARENGDTVSSPSIDDICNEMQAFFAGMNN